MREDLSDLGDLVDEVPVPISWDDVVRRAGITTDDRAVVRSRRRTPRPMVVVALVGVSAAAVALLVAGWRTDQPLLTRPSVAEPAQQPSPSEVPGVTTTLPATGTSRNGAVEVWTDRGYLVWGGEAGDESRVRADGWLFDPVTGADTTIPPAPIGPRARAAGVWTGTKLIVCCGSSTVEGQRTGMATAAAFDLDEMTWSPLADPPSVGDANALGAVWTGDEMLVFLAPPDQAQRTVAVVAYDPISDSWERRADAPSGSRTGEVVEANDSVIVWLTATGGSVPVDRGMRYDPDADEWSELPPLPDQHSPWYASAVWADDQLVVWGNDLTDDTVLVGYRWRPGDDQWRPMSAAPVDAVAWGEWTPGSQAMGRDDRDQRIIAVSLHPGGVDPLTPPRALLAYDPATDVWERLGEAPPAGYGYGRGLLVQNGLVLQPDVEQPVLLEVPGNRG